MKAVLSGYHPRQRHRHQGTAIIMFLLMVPVILGFMVFCLEGGRYLRTQASLGDATEATALAVSALDSENESENQTLAEKYISTHVPDSHNTTAKTRRHLCQDNPDCDENSSMTFLEFQVSATTEHESWFHGQEGQSFTKRVTVGHSAISRKYQDGTAMDVIFVADFSGSMNDLWKGTRKIDMLKDVLGRLADRIELSSSSSKNKNTMALVPFQGYTMTLDHTTGSLCTRFHLDPENYDKTIQNLFTQKPCAEQLDLQWYKRHGFHLFYTTSLTHSAQVLKRELSGMNEGGATASYEGIISGAQLAREGKNPRRLLIVLSDGLDVFANHHHELLDRNYCDLIRNEFAKQTTSDGQPVHLEIAVVGFDYRVQYNRSLQRCADQGKMMSAEDPQDVYRKVTSVIGEEIGHLYKGL